MCDPSRGLRATLEGGTGIPRSFLMSLCPAEEVSHGNLQVNSLALFVNDIPGLFSRLSGVTNQAVIELAGKKDRINYEEELPLCT